MKNWAQPLRSTAASTLSWPPVIFGGHRALAFFTYFRYAGGVDFGNKGGEHRKSISGRATINQGATRRQDLR